MQRSWFSSLSPVSVTAAALALLLTTATAQSRDDSDRNDSDSSSASADSGDRSDQSGRPTQMSRGARTGRQTSHPMLGVTFYSDQFAPLEIRRVTPGSPAEQAGLERGDEILSVDGRRVASVQQLRQQIDRIGTDEDIEFGVLRDGRRRTLTARLTANQQSSWNQQQSWNQRNQGQGQWSRSPEYEQGYWAGYERAQQEFGQSYGSQRAGGQGYAQGYGVRGQGYASRGYQSQGYGNQSYARGSRGAEGWQDEGYRGLRGGNQAFLGVTLDENARDAARVTHIYPNSPAEEAGIRPGDEILSIDDEEVNSSRDVRRLLSQKDTDDDVAIEVHRNGRPRVLHATLISQQEFLSSSNDSSYRMGRRPSYGQQGSSSESRSRRQQNQSSDQDQEHDNY